MTKRSIILDKMTPGVADLRSHLRITGSHLDGELQGKLLAAFRASEHYIGRMIALSDVVESVPFATTVTLGCRPVISVSSVKVDGEVTDAYSVSDGVLVFGGDVSGSSVEISYQAGMENPDYDIVAAVLMHAAALVNNPVDHVEALPKASQNLLRPYRTYGD